MHLAQICVLAAFVGLAGCASPSVPLAPLDSDLEGKAFRAPARGAAGLYIAAGAIPDVQTISIGQRVAGSLAQGTWLRVDLAPATYEISARSSYSTSSLSVTLVADTLTFVQLQYIDSRPWRDVLSELPESRARSLVLSGKRAARAP